MERDSRMQNTGGSGRGFLTVLAVAALVIFYVLVVLGTNSDKPSPDKGASQAEQKDGERTKGTADDRQTPGESKEAYIASCDEIGGRDAPIFYKDFLKNPNKFKDARVKVTGWIAQIYEDNGQTELQISIDDDGDLVIVE